ncbi:MAG: serine protease [Phycisphaerae bacterium]|nr:serine protease [Phycisphaerae bacterium]
MKMRRFTSPVLIGVGLAGLMGMAGPCAAAGAGTDGVAGSVGPQVCLVRVEGALGLPAAYASGFLMGEGRFVLTDLASVAQPGVKSVTVIFQDGTEAVAKTFSMADPAMGIAAIGVDLPPDKAAQGLDLSKAEEPKEGVPAEVVGWRGGKELIKTAGRLAGTVSGAELATALGFTEPGPDVEFLKFLCPSLDIATGAPVTGPDGTVLGIMVCIYGADKPLVAPSPLVRKALLAAGPQTKPLSALPRVLWPVALQKMPGKPPAPREFAAVCRSVKMSSVCPKCKGSGFIVVRVLDHYEVVATGLRRAVYRAEKRDCAACRTEGLVCGKGLYGKFSKMAEGATWLLWASNPPENVRNAAAENGMGLLGALGKVPPGYRGELTDQARSDMDAAAGEYPRGAVLYAQVCETVNIRGDEYTVLVPHKSESVLMVNSDTLVGAYSAEERAAGARPAEGSWIIVGGVLIGKADIQGSHPIFMQLFGWAFGPNLDRRVRRQPFASERVELPPTVIETGPTIPTTVTPTTPAEPVTPPRRLPPPPPPRPPKKPGEPSFFGL